MSLKVNGVELDLQDIRILVAKGKKINAIKYIKERTNLGLKQCKDIVDNLESNLDFYNGETEITFQSKTISKSISGTFKDSNSPRKRSKHIISNGNNNIKNYIILFLVTTVIILLTILLYK